MSAKPAESPTDRVAYVNARLLDPASGLDAPGALLTEGREIADLGPALFADGVPDEVRADVNVVDAYLGVAHDD